MQEPLYLTPNDHGHPLTLEVFQQARSMDGYQYELIDGKLEVWPLPELPHDGVRDFVRDRLRDYADRHSDSLKRVYKTAQVFVHSRPGTTAAKSDIAAYRDFPTYLPRSQLRWEDVSPIIVAEILWCDTVEKDLVRNVQLYLEVPSIREYWIIDPRDGANHPGLTVYRRHGEQWQQPILVSPVETYTTPLLLGFTLTLAEGGGESPKEYH